jgi:hypothetical protein
MRVHDALGPARGAEAPQELITWRSRGAYYCVHSMPLGVAASLKYNHRRILSFVRLHSAPWLTVSVSTRAPVLEAVRRFIRSCLVPEVLKQRSCPHEHHHGVS